MTSAQNGHACICGVDPRLTVVNDGGGAQANVRLNSHQSGPPPRHRRHDSSSPRAFLASPASRSCFASCLLVLSGNLSRAPPSVCGLSVTASFQVHTSGRVWPADVSISNAQTPLCPLQTGMAPRQNRPFLAARLLAPTAATVDDRPNLSRSSVPVPASSGDRAAEREVNTDHSRLSEALTPNDRGWSKGVLSRKGGVYDTILERESGETGDKTSGDR